MCLSFKPSILLRLACVHRDTLTSWERVGAAADLGGQAEVRDRQQSAVNSNAPRQPLGSTSASGWAWRTEVARADAETRPRALRATTVALKRTVHVRLR